MITFFKRFRDKYFGNQVDFRARIFNAMMIITSVTWMIGAAIARMSVRDESIAGFPALVCAAFTLVLIWYANKSGNYKLCYWIATVVIFMVQAAIAFFLNGGYKTGSIFGLFVINTAITAFLFDGKKAIVVPLILIVEYSAICVIAYYYPNTVRLLDDRALFSTILIVVVTCVSLCTIIILHVRLHERQKRELEEARRSAVEYEKLKSDFFSEMNHEFRTPLTVIATSAHMANLQIDEIDIKQKNIREELRSYNQIISVEANRLAGLTSYIIKTLSMPIESARKDTRSNGAKSIKDLKSLDAPYMFETIYVNDLVRTVSNIITPGAMQDGKNISVNTEEDIPQIRGDADALVRLMLNLLQNALCYGGNNIAVTARQTEDSVILTVEDDGAGIEPSLLENVFERGVSGKNSTGLGLYICRTIANAHGGDIKIENKNTGGVCATLTLPKGDSSGE